MLELRNLKKHYSHQKAVDDVSLRLLRGQRLGLVGESGSGKSTLAKLIMHLISPTGGEIFYQEKPYSRWYRSAKLEIRRHIQMIFQNPNSLDPRQTVEDILKEPLIIHGIYDRNRKVDALLRLTNLPLSAKKKYPHEFSGGEKQRIGIARALSLDPKILVCDEPVSALDVSIQASIINLFKDLSDELKISYLFISHDLNIVKHLSDQIAVMYQGKIVEKGSKDQIFKNPRHSYTKMLLKAQLTLPKSTLSPSSFLTCS